MLEQVEEIGQRSSQLAGPQTPLIKNSWYVAALSTEVTRVPMRRRIVNQDVLLYRTEGGVTVALQNRCAHRGFPLHRGRLNGDRIVCPYHGIEYGSNGQCAYVPTLDAAAAALKLQHYPTAEVGPFIWIWTGDPRLCDTASLAAHQWMGAPDWEVLYGSMHLNSNYVRMHENLMDLSHFAFLHSAHGLGTVEFARRKISVQTHGDQVCASWSMEVAAVDEVRVQHTPICGHRARREDETWFYGPGTHVGNGLYIDLEPRQGDKTRYESHVNHLLTPESLTSTHYFWVVGFDSPLPPGGREALHAVSQKVFAEDVEAVESIESLASWENRPEYSEASVRSDRAGLTVRKMIFDLAQRERS